MSRNYQLHGNTPLGKLRVAKGLSQSQLAGLLKVPAAKIWQYEHGLKPRPLRMAQLAAVLTDGDEGRLAAVLWAKRE